MCCCTNKRLYTYHLSIILGILTTAFCVLVLCVQIFVPIEVRISNYYVSLFISVVSIFIIMFISLLVYINMKCKEIYEENV